MTICFAVGIRRAGEAHPIIVLDLAARRAARELAGKRAGTQAKPEKKAAPFQGRRG